MSAVLVVVDMQNGFVSEKAKASGVVPRVVELVERWEATGQDVLFTRFLNHRGSKYERLINWSRFIPVLDDGTANPEIEIVDELADHAARARVLDKDGQYSPFPELDPLAAENGWSDLAICGIATESCVLETAMGAFDRGNFTPRVITDACFSHSGEERHQAGLTVLRAGIGRRQLVTTEDLFAGRLAA